MLVAPYTRIHTFEIFVYVTLISVRTVDAAIGIHVYVTR